MKRKPGYKPSHIRVGNCGVCGQKDLNHLPDCTDEYCHECCTYDNKKHEPNCSQAEIDRRKGDRRK